MNAKEIAHQILKEIRSEIANGDFPRVGLCVVFIDKLDNLPPDIRNDALGDAYRAMREPMTWWPKYSGSPYYPVNFDKSKGPSQEFHEAERYGTLYTGAYGALRLELLDYLIESTK